VKNNDYSLIKEVHLLLCGGKAMYTEWVNEGCITMIQACGGHGYLMSSGIGPILASQWPNAILEGENTVLLIQIAKELLKSYQKAMVGETKSLVGTLSYLSNIQQHLNYSAPTDKAKYRLTSTYLEMFASCTVRLTKKAAAKMKQAMAKGLNGQDAFDKVGALLIVDAAKLHTILFTLKYFDEVVKSLAEGPNKIALNNLALLFSVDCIQTFAGQIIDTRSINAAGMGFVKDLFAQLLEDIHPEAIGLAEAWGYTDAILGSAIGHSNGKPYENL